MLTMRANMELLPVLRITVIFVQHSERVQALIHAVDRVNFRTTLDVGNFVCVDEDSVAAVTNNLPLCLYCPCEGFLCSPLQSESRRRLV